MHQQWSKRNGSYAAQRSNDKDLTADVVSKVVFEVVGWGRGEKTTARNVPETRNRCEVAVVVRLSFEDVE